VLLLLSFQGGRAHLLSIYWHRVPVPQLAGCGEKVGGLEVWLLDMNRSGKLHSY
jgi:hypothetical protein